MRSKLPDANTYLPPTVLTPGFLLITAITQTYPMVITITDSDENSYIAGQLVRLTIPSSYGMFQANQLTGKIVSIDDTAFSVDIDARLFDAFSIPASGTTPASLAPAGSRNLEYSNSTNKVAFQSLNNQGN